MKPGDKWRLFVPSELGYGAQAAGPIQPNSTLIFDIELLKVAKQNSTENKQEK
jgi:FKBP-type peptidyl-prolyl cis-trans isomerase